MLRCHSKFDLYLVTDRAICAERGLVSIVDAASSAGLDAVQIRDDVTPDAELIALGLELLAFLRPRGVALIINNRVEIAAAIGADGVHIGQSDMPPAQARAMLGPSAVIGLSINDPAQVAAVDPDIVDHLGVGPIYGVEVKTDAAPAMGLEGLRRCRKATSLPIVAIGAIHTHHIPELIRAGADGIAVVRAIISADDVAGATRGLASQMAEAKMRHTV
ncbi:thiamine phosphate synthase [Inquilinus sp. CA228]|uniref:thiamine phosphate synthase n=1 Tax=Inquilinus sp. CA228 TaxID=3455609 RepID=UPI003F8D2D63